MTNLPTKTLLNLDFVDSTTDEVVEFLERAVKGDQLLTVATPNPEQIVLATEQPAFLQDLQKFDLRLPDGEGILWASRRHEAPLTARITGREVVARLLLAKKESWSILLVGGRDYPSALLNPGFQIVPLTVLGTQISWAKDFYRDRAEDTKAVLDWVKKHKPKIVFVALGAPHQEQWILKHQAELAKSGVKVAMVVGGAFDVLTGNVPAAPQFMQKLKLEWLWRLIQEPWRWRRQLKLVKFVQQVLTRQK